MGKKIFIGFLIFAFNSSLTGCYTFNSVTVPEYKQFEEDEGKPTEVYVKTKTNQWYYFTHSNFIIENDTL